MPSTARGGQLPGTGSAATTAPAGGELPSNVALLIRRGTTPSVPGSGASGLRASDRRPHFVDVTRVIAAARHVWAVVSAGLLRRTRCRVVVAVVELLALALVGSGQIGPPGAAASEASSSTETTAGRSTTGGRSASCPWATAAAQLEYTPSQLAAQVLARMTLSEKIGVVGLITRRPYENENSGIPSLCIPALTLQDGPDGLAADVTGVTQLPASIGVAASFDTSVAAQYGTVIGSEAKSLGVDVVQGPNLNVARLPNSGRIFEGYGEDPALVSAMGVAEIDAIQAQGVMAMAKHFSGYTQETARAGIDQTVSERVLQEIYFPPFEAAVEKAHVASVMCAVGDIDGAAACQSSNLFETLETDWGFTGFVRTDDGAYSNAAAAFDTGVDMIKPFDGTALRLAVLDGRVPIATLDGAVTRVLTEMFRFGLIEDPLPETSSGDCDCANHSGVALTTAERSMVLLKDDDGVLPLAKRSLESIAVIGQDAGSGAMTAGYGSAHVVAPFVSTPLAAIRQWAGKTVHVTYSAGGPPLRSVTEGGIVHDTRSDAAGTPDQLTADSPGTGPGWLERDPSFTPAVSGLYDFSLTSSGDTWLTVGGTPVISEPGIHDASQPWSAAVRLVAGRSYSVKLRWLDVDGADPELTWSDVTPMINSAVDAARHASIAAVFVSDYTSEGFDRPTLDLPGDANELISAVAAANPRTVVVLNTGGAVVMPWLSKVKAVLEAWYPGEEDGAATLAVLDGAVDPSGHLPVTFPPSAAQSPMGHVTSWPGVDGVVSLGGLDVGYRYYDAHHVRPLFPFGFGLSYTTFSLSGLKVTDTPSGYRVRVEVTDDGARSGRAVVQAYLGYPQAADEPAHKLVAFASVPVAAYSTTTETLTVPASALQVYLDGAFQTVPGTYTLSVGQNEADLPLQASVNVP